jgi:hypothetical protein
MPIEFLLQKGGKFTNTEFEHLSEFKPETIKTLTGDSRGLTRTFGGESREGLFRETILYDVSSLTV